MALIAGRLTLRWRGSALIGASLVKESDAWKIAGLTEDQLPAGTPR